MSFSQWCINYKHAETSKATMQSTLALNTSPLLCKGNFFILRPVSRTWMTQIYLISSKIAIAFMISFSVSGAYHHPPCEVTRYMLPFTNCKLILCQLNRLIFSRITDAILCRTYKVQGGYGKRTVAKFEDFKTFSWFRINNYSIDIHHILSVCIQPAL